MKLLVFKIKMITIPRKMLNQSTKTAGPVKGALEWCWSAALSRIGLLLDLPLALWITTYYLCLVALQSLQNLVDWVVHE